MTGASQAQRTHAYLYCVSPLFCLSEQVGQEILANLHSDREKIQRSRDRVRRVARAHMQETHAPDTNRYPHNLMSV